MLQLEMVRVKLVLLKMIVSLRHLCQHTNDMHDACWSTQALKDAVLIIQERRLPFVELDFDFLEGLHSRWRQWPNPACSNCTSCKSDNIEPTLLHPATVPACCIWV